MNNTKSGRILFRCILFVLLIASGMFLLGQSPPPTATTGAATGIGSWDVTLNGTVNANGLSTRVTFEYGPDTAYGSTFAAIQSPVTGTTDTAVSAIIYELEANTTYHYRVAATNAGGTTYGADLTFTTLPAPPGVLTNAATAISGGSATLNGMVNAHDSSATVSFEYGTDTNYGTTVTADQSPVSGSTATPVSKTVTGLSNGFTYHFRVKAQNAGGTAYGADMTFTAGLSAPTATTNAASAIETTTATLNGTVNANNSSTAVTFEYGFSTNYDRTSNASPGTVTGSTDTAVTLSLTSLIPATTYHYRVKAVSDGGTTYGADMTFRTRAAPTVTTNAVTAVTTTGATLNGTVNANNDSSTITFEYGTTTAYGTTVTADQSPVTGSTYTAVSKAITGLANNTIYHYRVVGQNVNGTSYGADMIFTTTIGAPTVTTDAATSVLVDGATLNGTVTANNSSTTVTFEYGTTTSYGTTVTAGQSPVTGVNKAVSKTITDLSNNTTYHYRVVGQNANGTTYGSDMTFTTSYQPTAITKAATGVGGNAATLNGLVNPNNYTSTVTFEYGTTTSYGSTVTADQSPVSGNTDTPVSKTITGLTNNTTYHYRVKVQSYSTFYGADMTFTTTTGPTATTNAATSVGASTATVNGTVNANNATTTVTFEYGLDTNYGKTAKANQSPVTGSSDTAVSSGLTFLIPNTTYHYRVVAQNVNGTVYGADMTFTTGASSPTATTTAATAVTSSGATLNGMVNARNDSTTVTFEYGTTTSYGTTVTADQSPLSGNSNNPVSKAITGLTGGTTYHYRVVAQNSSGTTYGADMTFYTSAVGPTATTQAATNVKDTTATLNGTVNANNNSTTVMFEYGPTSGYGRLAVADQSPVTGTTDTAVSADIDLLTPETTYHYRVVATNSTGTAYGADMTFTTEATGRIPTVTTASVTRITTKKAKSGGNVIDEGSVPVTIRGVCWSTSPNPTTADRTTDNGPGPGVFVSTLNKLTSSTTYFVRAYATNSVGTAYGEEYQFTTDSADVKVTIKRPHDGDEVSGTVKIKAVARGAAGSQSIAKVEFYIDDTKIAEVTKVPFKVHWDTTAYSDGSHTIKAVAYGEGGESSDDMITVTVNNSQTSAPEIATNRDQLTFSAVPAGKNGFLVTGAQTLLISSSDKLQWAADADTAWLSVSPPSGMESSEVIVSAVPKDMDAGSYSGTLKITDANSGKVFVTVPVELKVYNSGTTTAPFGDFETPVFGSTVNNCIAVSGWVLDDIEVTNVKIYRDPVDNEKNAQVYLGDATLVDGARPDVEFSYPDYPLNYRAGWGFVMQTHSLPNRGNGTFTLYAIAIDKEGYTVTLGSKIITADNARAAKPFGAIETLTQEGIAKGSKLVSSGWALTPQPNTIPFDGSTITIYVDGLPQGSPVYNRYNQGIAASFPGYNNSQGAGVNFSLDTSSYAYGLHTITWSVEDDAGNINSIDSRYFSIANAGKPGRSNPLGLITPGDIDRIAPRQMEPAFVKRGYRPAAETELLQIDEQGTGTLTIKEMERVEIELGTNIASAWGYLVAGDRLRDLPAGSTLDHNSGLFTWQPGPGYFGKYAMIFVIKDTTGMYTRTLIHVNIEAKFNK